MSKSLEEFIEKKLEEHGAMEIDGIDLIRDVIKEVLRVVEEWCDEAYTEDSNGLFRGLKKEKLTAGALLYKLKSWAGVSDQERGEGE